MSTNTFGALFGALLIVVSLQDALAFSKYGRDCRDIGCLRDEECVIKEDPCTPYTGNKCGRYPTCRKISAKSCTGVICYENEYCKMVNNAPRCVDKDEEDGYESAGVSYVNGQRVGSGEKHGNGQPSANSNNMNPYANANAPPAPVEPSPTGGNAGNYHRTNTPTNHGTNLGYPPYPSNTGSATNNNGYPPYPSSNQGNRAGYNPAYPPVPGQQGYPNQNPPAGYPAQPGYHPQQYPPVGQRYPAGQYPGYQNYPQQNQRGFGYNTPSVHYGPPSSAPHFSYSFLTFSLSAASLFLANSLQLC